MYNILVVTTSETSYQRKDLPICVRATMYMKHMTGKTALDVLSKNDIHLVLMDIMMPKMDGITALTKLREGI